jgi:hypothetical protein
MHCPSIYLLQSAAVAYTSWHGFMTVSNH